MAKEYNVTVDQSLKAENNPKALEKHMQELGREGWELKHVPLAEDYPRVASRDSVRSMPTSAL